MIRYIKKDITTLTHAVIVHGVNAQGVMGAGVAKAIRNRWPDLMKPYVDLCKLYKDHQKELLGKISTYVNKQDGVVIVNGITQLYYGNDGIKYANPQAIHEVILTAVDILSALVTYSKRTQNIDVPEVIYMPKIGCKRGGLDWKTEVLPIVEELQKKFPTIDFVICDVV